MLGCGHLGLVDWVWDLSSSLARELLLGHAVALLMQTGEFVVKLGRSWKL